MRAAAFVLAALMAWGPAAPASAQWSRGMVRERIERGIQRFNRQDYAGAIALFDGVLKLEPRHPIALSWRGQAYDALGDYPRAMADADAVLAGNPKHPNALANACIARIYANVELDRALTYCDAAVEHGGDFRHLDSRGLLRLRRGEYRLAAADYEATLRKQPKLADALYGRGVARACGSQAAEGAADMAAAVNLEPEIAKRFARIGLAGGCAAGD